MSIMKRRNRIQTHIDTHEGEHIITAAGTPTGSTPPVNDRLHNLKIYGKSLQNGIPTPDAPVAINNVPSGFALKSQNKNFIFLRNTPSGEDAPRGISITRNDGVYTLSGTNNGAGTSFFLLLYNNLDGILLPAGSYVLTGCPAGGGASTYRLAGGVTATPGGGDIAWFNDAGNGATLTLTKPRYVWIRIEVASGYAISGSITFRPMLRLSTSNAAFVPQRLTTTPFTVKDTGNNLYELCSLPNDIKDEISNQKIVKRTKVLNLTGAENWVRNADWNGKTVFQLWDSGVKRSGSDLVTALRCNKFRAVTNGRMWGDSISTLGYACAVHSTVDIILFTGPGLVDLTLAEFKTWLDANNVQVLFERNSINYDDLHADEAAKLKSVKSVQNYTQIFTDVAVAPTISCGIRKLGNRALIGFNLTDESGNYITDENGNKLGGMY